MEHIQIKNFREGDIVEGFYAVKDATLQTASTGKSYIRIILSDSSGAISGNMWDASKDLFTTFSAGSVVKVRAVIENYRGKPQVKLERLRIAQPSEVDYSVFLPATAFDIDELWSEFSGFIAGIGDPDYRRIVQHIFSKKGVEERFRLSPAAKNNHHAYIGGLLEHTVSLLRYAVSFAAASPSDMDLDLLVAGTVLHDIGKIYELSTGVIIDYTDEGKLLGHLIIGANMVERAAGELDEFPPEKKYLLEHMILSHHGKYEYGSPVLPAVPEAFALHHIDNLDAKTVAACRILAEDESENSWTERSWVLDTMLYKKGRGHFDSSADAVTGDSDEAADPTGDLLDDISEEFEEDPSIEPGRLF